MNPHSLLASAAINIALALIVLSLFSILKKQPSLASIYYAHRLSHHHYIHFDSSLHRFLPSISWISRAFHVTEDDFLQSHGLDALVIIRLFKFGIKFFAVCSLVGLVVLLPINYYGVKEVRDMRYSTMDSFTISNVPRGSRRLWVHFACLCFISFYGMYLLYKEYKEISIRRMQQLQSLKHRPDRFTVVVREIPLCLEHKAYDCCVDHFFSKHYPNTYYSYQMVYNTENLDELMDQTQSLERKIDELKETSMARKHKNKMFLLDTSQQQTSEVGLLEEKLHALCQKIHQLQCKDMLKKKELPVAFVTFKSRSAAAVAAQLQQHSHPLLWVTELAPEPRDVSWRNLRVSYRVVPLYKLGVVIAASLLTVFFAIPVTAVQGIARYEKLKKWFPPVMVVQFIPGLSSIVTGYLPSVVLKGFIYIVPFAMFAMAKVAGWVARSKEEIKACNMVFYFLVGNVFVVSVLSGSLLDIIGKFISHPKIITSELATAVSAQADFFVTYILTDGLSGFSLEVLQPGLLIWDTFKSCILGCQRKKSPYLYSLPYFRIIPFVSLSILIGLVYAVVAPLLLPFLIVYFCLGYVVYINQITMIGLFGLKLKPAASILTIPLLFITLMFNEYCKMRFLPSFDHYSLEDAAENDELDEKCGRLNSEFYEKSVNAYCPPGLRPVSFAATESSSTPLISS
ncbi:CSC1-like protein At3g54510 isoform X2 [Vicia villosa]|uniref:CSC1-like protein At3g54510 isoform X2 n=1 Tax=Vicia villosa TaxID=3911 RepID=UPI00273C6F93|nr:CSC1-like protein At3g54510 isoform X2 [Vicia villosa]